MSKNVLKPHKSGSHFRGTYYSQNKTLNYFYFTARKSLIQ